MVNSNSRKLTLSAWLKIHSEPEYNSPLKFQKFLFLYEAFSKVAGDKKTDFDHLRGYKNGPIFSNVFGDYTKERAEFERKANACYELFGKKLNHERALQCSFIVATLSELELSELTHAMNIWKSQADLITKGYLQVQLYEADFNDDDCRMIKTLENIYPLEMIKSSEVVNVGNYYFVISKADFKRLTEEHFDILSAVSLTDELHNPVFAEIDEKGGLLID